MQKLRFLLGLFLFPLYLPGVRAASNEPVAAIFTNSWTSPELAGAMADDVSQAGFKTHFIGVDILTNADALISADFDMLVLPHARSLPIASMKAVGRFLERRGNLLALGLPAWQSGVFEVDGKTISKPEFQRMLDHVTPDHPIVDFGRDDLSKWFRSVEGAETKTRIETVPLDGQKALHVIIDNLGGWDTFASPKLDNPFPDGRSLTCFRARGSKETPEMSLEWAEEDGSRWIAVIDLDTEWKSYALPPEAFHYWASNPKRGWRGDRLDVRHAVKLTVGLARSHAGFVNSHLEYSIGNIGSARLPYSGAQSFEEAGAPMFDTISPDWKFYPIHGPAEISTPEGLALLTAQRLSSPEHDKVLEAMHPRPRGMGFHQDRPWRWQPLLEARDSVGRGGSPSRPGEDAGAGGPDQGDYRGALASLLIHSEGGLWACFTPDDDEFYKQPAARKVLTETAKAMRRGVFLFEGGAQYFTAFENQDIPLGARLVDFATSGEADVSLRITVKSKEDQAIAYSRTWPLHLSLGSSTMEDQNWKPVSWPKGGFVVTTELLQEGQVIDRLESDLNVWRPKPKPEFVEERDGGFWLGGKPWKISGVNYMPSTGIGVTGGNYFEHWLGKGAYDPEAIERDLRRIKGMNLNAVSIFVYHEDRFAQHLLDFLRRCDELGLHANLSLRPGSPMDFQWSKMKDLLEYFHMPENDTLFAYDLAWEAEHQDEQNSYGKDWTAWVTRRYQTVAQAEKVWGVPATAVDSEGTLQVPPLGRLAQDGPWRIWVADYRAFLDSELDWKYGEARRLMRSVDPNHAVSFRMSEAGDPTMISDSRLPYDFYGLRKAVDIWEPEAYGRIGEWSRVRQGRFEIDYARLCDPNKPVIWAEMGYSSWEERRNEAPPQNLEFAAQFCRDFYHMMTEAGCDGVFFWWYPGGYRFNERSDFGIINPDGTDRPESKIIREEGPKFLEAAKPPKPDYFISIDRDQDARGIFGIYQAVKNDYWQAVADGKRPGLKWAHEPGANPRADDK